MHPSLDPVDELPLLTELADIPHELPILSEIVAEAPAPSHSTIATPALPQTLSEEQVQQLLRQLESHLETVFTSKLNNHLERLQRLAVDLAVSELKAELPQLLRDALNNPVLNR